MTIQQVVLIGILIATLGLFIGSRWRYDVVALFALIGVVFIGAIDPGKAFFGFGHPAVVTVAMVLVLSRALQNAGAVDLIGEFVSKVGNRTCVQVGVLTAIVTLISGFMNNVGAIAILMPVALNIARTTGTSPSHLLIPLAFGSLLGGMTTLIGTPPNLIVSGFREATMGESYGLFDFTPVGAVVALVGVVFLSLIGWWLLPVRRKEASSEELFEIQSYVTELVVGEGSPFVGKTLAELGKSVDREGDILFLELVRKERRFSVVYPGEVLQIGDILVVEANSAVLENLTQAELQIIANGEDDKEVVNKGEQVVVEAVVMPNSRIIYRKPEDLRLSNRFGVNILAIARQGKRLTERFRNIRLKPSDVLLLRGPQQAVQQVLSVIGCLPLAKRGLRVGEKRKLAGTVGIFTGALAAVATGVLSIQMAFLTAIVLMVVFGMIPVQELYDSIDWPIIVLLGAMIPVGEALETTGTAKLIAEQLLVISNWLSPAWVLGAVLVCSMFLSDIVNNAAAAVLMAPIAFGVADGLGVSPDPFLMAVAIGASCAFLTPIGHQSSALVMGPGGYHFGDYWKVGLPLEILIVTVAMPALLYFWPLSG